MWNYFEIRPVVLEKKIFKVFYIAIYGKLAPPLSRGHVFRDVILWTTLVKVHPRNIPAKFHQIVSSGFRGDVVFKVWTYDVRHKMDAGRTPITISQRLTWVASGELKGDIFRFLGFQLGLFQLECLFILLNFPSNWVKKANFVLNVQYDHSEGILACICHESR